MAVISYLGEERFIDLMFSPGMTHPLRGGPGAAPPLGARLTSGGGSGLPSPLPLSRQESGAAAAAGAQRPAGGAPRRSAFASAEEEQQILKMVDEELALVDHMPERRRLQQRQQPLRRHSTSELPPGLSFDARQRERRGDAQSAQLGRQQEGQAAGRSSAPAALHRGPAAAAAVQEPLGGAAWPAGQDAQRRWSADDRLVQLAAPDGASPEANAAAVVAWRDSLLQQPGPQEEPAAFTATVGPGGSSGLRRSPSAAERGAMAGEAEEGEAVGAGATPVQRSARVPEPKSQSRLPSPFGAVANWAHPSRCVDEGQMQVFGW